MAAAYTASGVLRGMATGYETEQVEQEHDIEAEQRNADLRLQVDTLNADVATAVGVVPATPGVISMPEAIPGAMPKLPNAPPARNKRPSLSRARAAPSPGDGNFYFFPNAFTDHNNNIIINYHN